MNRLIDQLRAWRQRFWRGLLLCAIGLPCLLTSGCVSKGHAQAEARAAYQAGQNDAMLRLQQIRGPSVVIAGPVRDSVVPWTPELTLAKAIVIAGYLAPKDPQRIAIIRNGEQIAIDPKALLGGEDVPVQSGDVIKLEP